MDAGHGGPFGAVIVDSRGEVIAAAHNRVVADHDPTAHAEVNAIRAACQRRGHFELTDCVLYTSCEPCPMCLGAVYWARLAAVYFASSREQAAAAGFDDAHIYQQVSELPADRSIPFEHRWVDDAGSEFQRWLDKSSRVPY